jgi:hypothetical protein
LHRFYGLELGVSGSGLISGLVARGATKWFEVLAFWFRVSDFGFPGCPWSTAALPHPALRRCGELRWPDGQVELQEEAGAGLSFIPGSQIEFAKLLVVVQMFKL